MRRLVPLALFLLASPAGAWEFTPVPVCTLRHAGNGHSLTVTWDPRQAEPYAIAIGTTAPWPEAPVFAIDFAGPRPLSIATARHRLSEGGRTVTVTDTGFGNVLDGLEFNVTATAVMGAARVPFPLAGAAEKVREFRACATAALAAIRPARKRAAHG